MKTLRNLFLILLVSFTGKAFAQAFSKSDSVKWETSGGYALFTLELPSINTSDLNQRLAFLGFPALKYPSAVIGFGVTGQSKHTVFLASYNSSTKEGDYLNANTYVRYRSTTFAYGHDFIESPYFSFYPYLGYKSTRLSYTYRDKVNATFNNYFTGAFTEKEITNLRHNIDLGMGFSYQGIIQLGARGGVLLPVNRQAWRVHNNQVKLHDFPGVKHEYYITLFIGFGSIKQEKVSSLGRSRLGKGRQT